MKVAIIGATGNVGCHIAFSLILKNNVRELILIDVLKDKLDSLIYDLVDAAYCTSCVVKKGEFKDAGSCDIIIISAGRGQANANETRDALLSANVNIYKSIFNSIGKINDTTLILVVSNPVDILTAVAQKLSGLPKNQVFGSGTYLDTLRLRSQISQKVGVYEGDVLAYVIGEHGDSQIVPWSLASIAGEPLIEKLNENSLSINEIAEETKNRAYKIIAGLGYTAYGIGAAVSNIVEMINSDKCHILVLSHYVDYHNTYMSSLAMLSNKGIVKSITLNLNDSEKNELDNAVTKLQKNSKFALDLCNN